MRIQTDSTGASPGPLYLAGALESVLRGQIPAALLQQRYNAGDYLYGFELASPHDASSLGEAVLVNGRLFATDTDTNSPSYYQTISGESFIAGAMLLVPHDTPCSHRMRVEAPDTLSLEDLYAQIVHTTGGASVYVGRVRLGTFHATAIGRPPTDGKPLFGPGADPELFPPYRGHDQWAWITGIAAPTKEVRADTRPFRLSSLLYDNPAENSGPLLSHTHMLTLLGPIETETEITPDRVDRVLHLYGAGSVLLEADLQLFSVKVLQAPPQG